jgi:alpha-galactosidase/6-phospho-beta-glucosidase family protein
LGEGEAPSKIAIIEGVAWSSTRICLGDITKKPGLTGMTASLMHIDEECLCSRMRWAERMLDEMLAAEKSWLPQFL